MPDLKPVPQLQPINLENQPYLEGLPDDPEAVSLVVNTFGEYERARFTHERRWSDAENLYHGVVEQRKWEGTNIDRASLSVPIVYDQIEASHPLLVEALLDYHPTFFDTVAQPGTTPEDATRIRAVIGAQFAEPMDSDGFAPIAHIPQAIKQAQKFGDGAIELYWDPEKKRWGIEWVDIRDLYWDATAPGPLIDLSPSVIHRKLLSVEYLQSLRDTDGFSIPSDEELNSLAKARQITTGDMARQRAAFARKEFFSINQLRVDPKHQLVEVMVYWTKKTQIWILGRLHCALSAENPYGFIPYCKAPFTIIEGRPYSMGLPDVLEGNQKYIQGIRNARLDNLSLQLRPPRIRAAGAPTSPSKDAMQPGLVWELQKADDGSFVKVENFTQDSYREEEIIRGDAANRTGINQGTTSGVPVASNANRSATGVTAQAQSVSKRLQTAVKNFEDYLIVPMLYKIYQMQQRFAPEIFEVSDAKGNTISASRQDFQKPVKFVVTAASRMVVKDRLAMFLGPITQMIFNPEVMHQANLQGKTIDFNEWSRFMQDATATSLSYAFFRDMEGDEEAKLQQPDPKTQAQMQMKQLDAQTRVQMGQMKAQTEGDKADKMLLAHTNESGEKSARELLKLLSGGQDGLDKSGEKGRSKPKKS